MLTADDSPPGTKDYRALAFPDVPYSGCCRVCGSGVYSLWVDVEHLPDGSCPNGPCCIRNKKEDV